MKASAGTPATLACCAALLLASPMFAAAAATSAHEATRALLATRAKAKEAQPGGKAGGKDLFPTAISKVVNMLEGMMTKSKEEGDNERKLYAKYKCYCDTTKATKEGEIKTAEEEISTFEGKIEETQGSSGSLSAEVAKLKADMATNRASKTEAVDTFNNGQTAYNNQDSDYNDGIKQMTDALKTLSDVGADQTQQASADHTQYMADYKNASLIEVQKTVNEALMAASAMMNQSQAATMTSFIQGAPGNYAAQSGEVVGILKAMRDTFKANRAEATRKFDLTDAAHKNYKQELEDDHKAMDNKYKSKQSSLGKNDLALVTLRTQKKAAESKKADAESFVTTLKTKCKAKAEDYEKRVDLRVSEQAAISQAVQILNEDDAHHSINKANAKVHADAYIQEKSVSRHGLLSLSFLQTQQTSASKAFLQQLEPASGGEAAGGTSALIKIATVVKERTTNVFDAVLLEIMKMQAKIVREAKVDKAQKAWCKEERKITNDDIKKKNGQISELNTDISTITTEIEDPATGLLFQISTEENSLSECIKQQGTETKTRQEENAEYQEEIANFVKSQELIKKASRVLKKYYEENVKEEATTTEPPMFMQVQADPGASPGPKGPDTWEGDFKGQSTQGKTVSATLATILANMAKGEKNAHSSEVTAQHAFEDSMTKLTKDEKDSQDSLATLRVSLTEKKKTLHQKTKDQKATTKEKDELEEYLLDIKPECDYINENIVTRNFNRGEEKKALDKAIKSIKGTKAYKNEVLDDQIANR